MTSMDYSTFLSEYPNFKEHRLDRRRFDPKQWEALLLDWGNSPYLRIQAIGKSFEGRVLNALVFGQGPRRIAAWSQMHGDEATATLALADIFHLLSQNTPFAQKLREILHQKISFHALAYFNQDGASRWCRETALGIDMNRDALSQNSPEAKLLDQWVSEINPQFAFNLHDQNRLYSAGNSPHQTQIAWLATTGDAEQSWTPSRLRAGKLANRMARHLQASIPKGLARWNDDYEPRAFGEYFQSKGFGLLLLESGGTGFDLEKTTLRTYNACLLLDALVSIATDSWEKEDLSVYEHLPINERCLGDIKLMKAPLDAQGKYRADVLLNLIEIPKGSHGFDLEWEVEDIGDLRHLQGLQCLDAHAWSHKDFVSLHKQMRLRELIFAHQNEICFQLSQFTKLYQHA